MRGRANKKLIIISKDGKLIVESRAKILDALNTHQRIEIYLDFSFIDKNDLVLMNTLEECSMLGADVYWSDISEDSEYETDNAECAREENRRNILGYFYTVTGRIISVQRLEEADGFGLLVRLLPIGSSNALSVFVPSSLLPIDVGTGSIIKVWYLTNIAERSTLGYFAPAEIFAECIHLRIIGKGRIKRNDWISTKDIVDQILTGLAIKGSSSLGESEIKFLINERLKNEVLYISPSDELYIIKRVREEIMKRKSRESFIKRLNRCLKRIFT